MKGPWETTFGSNHRGCLRNRGIPLYILKISTCGPPLRKREPMGSWRKLLPTMVAKRLFLPKKTRGICLEILGMSSGLEPSISRFFSSRKKKKIKMAAMHPAALWLIIAAVVGIFLLIATLVANRNQKKKKNGKCVNNFLHYFKR